MRATRPYRKIESHRLSPATTIQSYHEVRPAVLSHDAPATEVMTDLKHVRLITIEADAGINDALHLMMHAGVRMLVVTDREGIAGIITSRDINGEKPVDFISRHRVTRDQVKVSDIMTPRSELDVLMLSDVAKARVGDIILTLREAGRQHAIVVEKAGAGELMLRGIFSATQIGRQLGISLEPTGQVQSFAELEAVLAR
ncbi:MAG: hypothetical protein Kow006_30490 [Gammaproteobacteria bacterium]